MIYFLLLLNTLFLHVSSAHAPVERVVLGQVQDHELSKDGWNNISRSNLPFDRSYRRQGNQLKAAQGHMLYRGRLKSGSILLISVETSKDRLPKEVALTLNFTIHSQGNAIMIYCSCGLQTVLTVGDNCRTYDTAEGVRCGGSCGGPNAGSICNWTMFNINTGEVQQY